MVYSFANKFDKQMEFGCNLLSNSSHYENAVILCVYTAQNQYW